MPRVTTVVAEGPESGAGAMGYGRDTTRSNAKALAGESQEATAAADAVLIDLGDDEYTLGRPHPMIEPAVRDAPLAAALEDASVAVILTDIVLGYGGHLDPAGHLAGMLKRHPARRAHVIASVTGTDADPQVRSRQIAQLEAVGVHVAASNARAAEIAASLVSSP